MKRFLAAAALAAAAFAPAAHADPIPLPGTPCDGVVDVFCRDHVCGEDELDCGMIPPCVVWVAGSCWIQ